MARQSAKFYKFKCTECDERFEKLMWTHDGVQQGVNCPACDTHLTYTKETADVIKQFGEGPMLNRRENWKKKVPSEFKEWMETSFAERHGMENTINMRD